MPKSKAQKQAILDSLVEKINASKSIVFAGFNALSVKDNEELRRKLRSEQNEYYVAKKTLLGLALKQSNLKEVDLDTGSLPGQVGAVFGYGDEISPAKIVEGFKKEKENKVVSLGGILENRFISAQEVTALALIPSRTELYAKLVGSINAPVSGFVNVLAGNLRNFVSVLNNIKDQKSN